MEQTDNKEHPLFWLAIALSLDGKRCAVCGHEYNSRESVEAHEPKKGYGDDVIGAECWDRYEEAQNETTNLSQ